MDYEVLGQEYSHHDLKSPSFWARFAPSLTVSEELTLDYAADETSSRYARDVERDGVTIVTSAVPKELCYRLADGILEIRASLGHEILTLIYDEPWLALAQTLGVVESIVGPGVRAVPMPFVNVVPPGGSGFPPHRDRRHVPLAEDGSPNLMTVWTAVTDAPPERACLAVLPTRFDPNFPDGLEKFDISRVQDIRALPVQAGDAVVFNQATLHMGTRNVTEHYRLSFAIELEREGLEGARSPYLDLRSGVSLSDRLSLVGVTIGALSHNNISFADGTLSLAKAMAASQHQGRYDALFPSAPAQSDPGDVSMERREVKT